MTRILPGVEIQVIKEIVPQQLNPSGVVAMIGTTEKGEALVPTPVSSYAEFADKFGSSDKFTVTKDAKQAFQNGVFQVVVVPISGKDGTKATLALKDRKDRDTVVLTAKSSGEEGNKISVKVEPIEGSDAVRMSVTDGASLEIYEGITMNATTDTYLVDTVNKRSALVTAADQHSSKQPNNLPRSHRGFAGGRRHGSDL